MLKENNKGVSARRRSDACCDENENENKQASKQKNKLWKLSLVSESDRPIVVTLDIAIEATAIPKREPHISRPPSSLFCEPTDRLCCQSVVDSFSRLV